MKIKKLFRSTLFPYHMVLETVDGEYKRFYICPFREITRKDLEAVPFWQPAGRNAEEADPWMYKFYGFEKE